MHRRGAPSTNARARRIKSRFARLYLEVLEDRSLPSISPLDPAATPVALEASTPEYDEGQIIVRFSPEVNPGDVASATLPGSALGQELLESVYLVQLDAGITVPDALAAYQASPFVVYAEPDYILQIDTIPNDPMFSSLWGLHNTGQNGGTADADIDAPEAWDIVTGAGSVIVAVIDTGVKWDHVDLAGNMWTNTDEVPGNGVDDDGNGYIDDVRGWDFVNNDNNPMDDNGHGTHVAGTIGAVGNNSIGVVGVVWDVQIMPLKFLSGSGGGTTSNAILAIRYAHRNGATVTNNSWGGGGYSQALYDAIKEGRDVYDAVFVAAAGNAGRNTDGSPFYPASYDLSNIISVAATDRNDLLASFSNYGVVTVDLGAPGVAITSTWYNGGYGTISGTSMASPHVAGAVAMVRAYFGNYDYAQAIQQILDSVDPLASLNGKVKTGGRLNLYRAVATGGTGAVGDLVWYDIDGDGVQERGESGLGSILVKLYTAAGQFKDQTTSSGSGSYAFAGVSPGDYYLEFVAPAGMVFSPKDQGGNEATDSDVDPSSGRTDIFTITAGVTITYIDAGLTDSSTPPPPPPAPPPLKEPDRGGGPVPVGSFSAPFIPDAAGGETADQSFLTSADSGDNSGTGAEAATFLAGNDAAPAVALEVEVGTVGRIELPSASETDDFFANLYLPLDFWTGSF
jgi:subtilisin family serine protease